MEGAGYVHPENFCKTIFIVRKMNSVRFFVIKKSAVERKATTKPKKTRKRVKVIRLVA